MCKVTYEYPFSICIYARMVSGVVCNESSRVLFNNIKLRNIVHAFMYHNMYRSVKEYG